MITEDKISEIFCIADDFCKEFDKEIEKNALPAQDGIARRRRKRMKVFRDIATKGKSTMGWYIGFKLHLLCNEKGEIISFVLTRANVDDRNESVMDSLTDKVFGKLYADKGYISQSLFGRLWDDGIHIVTGLRSNMKQRLMPLYDKIMLRKKSIIESLNDMLKNVAQLVHSRHRSVHNFLMNLLGAMGAYCFFAVKPGVNFDFEVSASDGQLVLWD